MQHCVGLWRHLSVLASAETRANSAILSSAPIPAQCERFIAARPAYTSCSTSHETGARRLYTGQCVWFEWQSAHLLSRIPRTFCGTALPSRICPRVASPRTSPHGCTNESATLVKAEKQGAEANWSPQHHRDSRCSPVIPDNVASTTASFAPLGNKAYVRNAQHVLQAIGRTLSWGQAMAPIRVRAAEMPSTLRCETSRCLRPFCITWWMWRSEP